MDFSTFGLQVQNYEKKSEMSVRGPFNFTSFNLNIFPNLKTVGVKCFLFSTNQSLDKFLATVCRIDAPRVPESLLTISVILIEILREGTGGHFAPYETRVDPRRPRVLVGATL